MVARDGIEPPTPAFSGPRSTTELPGLGMGFAPDSGQPSVVRGREAGSDRTEVPRRFQRLNKYSNPARVSQTACFSRGESAIC